MIGGFRIPKHIVANTGKNIRCDCGTARPGCFQYRDLGTTILVTKHFIHHRAHPVDVLVADLNETASALRQQLPRHHQPVAQVLQVGVDPVAPGVAKGFHLLGLAGQVREVAVLHVAGGRRPLEVGVELDAVGRVDVDRLDLALEPLALGEARHHLQAVAQDHPVRPALVVPVELDLRLAVVVGEAEMVEEVDPRPLTIALPARAHVFDDRFGVHLFLKVDRRRVDGDGGLVDVLAPPDELRVEIGVAPLVCHLDRRRVVRIHHRRELGRGDVHPGVVMGDRVDGGLLVGHFLTLRPKARRHRLQTVWCASRVCRPRTRAPSACIPSM